MSDPSPLMLAFLRTLTFLLALIFLGCCWELVRGYRRGKHIPYRYVGHRWQVRPLGQARWYYVCERCPARRVVREEG